MAGYNQKIKELEDELKKTKYNKRTESAIGLLKAKIARLKEKDVQRSKGGGKREGYTVSRSGDATAILIGYPSVGKSTLLNSITDADSEIGAYEFTTLDCIPGTLEYRHAKIQILDVPGIVLGASSGRGRGKEVLSVSRSADLCIYVVDIMHPEHLDVIKKEVYDTGIRVNKTKPDVKIRKTAKGGISIGTTVKLTRISDETIERILKEFRIQNADVLIRTDIDADDLIDIIETSKRYIPGITVLTKADLVDERTVQEIKKKTSADVVLSCETGRGLDELKEAIFDSLSFMPIFCKEKGKKADMDVPLIMKHPGTVEDMCNKLHRDFIDKFRYARIWGKSAKFPGQRKGLNHQLKPDDIVEIHLD
jgi:hypothetical protein